MNLFSANVSGAACRIRHFLFNRLPNCLLIIAIVWTTPLFAVPRAYEDDKSFNELLNGFLACSLSRELMEDLDIKPVYSDSSGSCQAVPGSELNDGLYYSDAACSQSLPFQRTSQQTYCDAALDKLRLGDAADLQGRGAYWTLSPGNLYDVGAASLKGLIQPYLQRTTYKSVDTAKGVCHLEMRVYQNTPGEKGLRSMLALHGGSWRARGFGFFGLEMTAPQFTEAGYVVFAPFYRLIGDSEGPAACHNASIGDVVDDAQDALQWVVEHAADYGATDYPTVFGQSAGAHLAVSLAVNQPEKVANAVLYYPPTDFTEFALRAQDGSYTNAEGLGILKAVMGVDAPNIDVSASPVPENTFPAMIEPDPTLFPPMFMLHGLADELVVATQSIRLCGALGGHIETAGDRDTYLAEPDLRIRRDCDDRGSQMHLIRDGDHALDICLSSNSLLSSACQSGGPDSRVLVASSVKSSISWASTIADRRLAERVSSDGEVNTSGVDDNVGENSGRSAGGSLGYAGVLMLLLPAAFKSCRRQSGNRC